MCSGEAERGGRREQVGMKASEKLGRGGRNKTGRLAIARSAAVRRRRRTARAASASSSPPRGAAANCRQRIALSRFQKKTDANRERRRTAGIAQRCRTFSKKKSEGKRRRRTAGIVSDAELSAKKRTIQGIMANCRHRSAMPNRRQKNRCTQRVGRTADSAVRCRTIDRRSRRKSAGRSLRPRRPAILAVLRSLRPAGADRNEFYP